MIYKTLTIPFLLNMIVAYHAVASTAEVTCHRPTPTSPGGEVLSEIEFTTFNKKKIVEPGPIHIKIWKDKDIMTFHTEVMSGQSIGTDKFLLFLRDLRLHSLYLTFSEGETSYIRMHQGESILDIPTQCATPPPISKKKSA